MHPQLSELESEFNTALVRLHQLKKDVPSSSWSRRPAPERWSPGECVAHLNLTSAATIPKVRAGLDDARRRGAAAPSRYRRDVVGWLLWKNLKPSGGFRVKTAPAFVPTGDRSPDELVAEFERLQTEQIACVRQADGLPIHLVKITSPFDARVRYNIFSALSILARHQHRHLWQAERASQ
jgi:hypothetical protein